MSDINDPAILRAAKAYAKSSYERQSVASAQVPPGLEAIGPPSWNRASWDLFRATFGRWPSLQEGDLPNLEGCPDWAFELMGRRRTPVDVSTGNAGANYAGVDDITLWRVR